MLNEKERTIERKELKSEKSEKKDRTTELQNLRAAEKEMTNVE